MRKIVSVVGARPNFMKVAPINKAFQAFNTQIEHVLCHTGQHYDANMSKVFFEDLDLPRPKFYLGIGSGSHAVQTANTMIKFEEILTDYRPDMVLVVGDVNSTIACSLTAAKLHIKTVHVEAGLRSCDRTMPEEINRILTDSIADFLFVTEKSGMLNLKNEGISPGKFFLVGNCMIDSLVYYLPKAEKSEILKNYALEKYKYLLVTLHRPSNVDDMSKFSAIIKMLNDLSKSRKIIFPIHPRTRKNMQNYGLDSLLHPNICLTDPFGYIDFLALTQNAELVVTDSGGIQEETTYLGVQCITLRENTERPITVEIGTNQLLGENLDLAKAACLDIIGGQVKKGRIPELWDGHASERIVQILKDYL